MGVAASAPDGLLLCLSPATALPCCFARVPQPPALIARESLAVHIVCDYVLLILLMAVGLVVQWRMTARLLAAPAGQPSTAVGSDVEAGGDVDVGVSLQLRDSPGAAGVATAAAPARDDVCTTG